MTNYLIEVNNLTKTYNTNTSDINSFVLKDISFTVEAGQTLAIIGPSGCGKSTILKILAKLEQPTTGRIQLNSNRTGMAFQYSALLNSYTVFENVEMALHNTNLSKREKEFIVKEKLEILGLGEMANRYPDQLSGGQQKRVGFARAVVHEPLIVFYDEPTAGLDPINSTLIENYMVRLQDRYHSANIVVTHQHSTIRRTADWIICIHKGNIVWAGDQEALIHDQNPYIRQFIDGLSEGPFQD